MRPDRLASILVVRPLIGLGVIQPKPGIPILMYHSVSDDSEVGVAPYYRLTTSPARFRQQMLWLREAGYRSIDLTEACRRLESDTGGTERVVVVTFDDGFEDFLTGAWPVLNELKLSATVFLPTAFIGDRRKSFRGRNCLTWAEVERLCECGVSFGAHTVNHSRLHELPWEEVQRELRDSRARLEDHLQLPVETFAYPYAFPQEDHEFVARFRDELQASGYRAAVTTAIGRALPTDDRLCLKRLPANECDDEPLFRSKLEGGYDWVGRFQGMFRLAKRHSRVFTDA